MPTTYMCLKCVDHPCKGPNETYLQQVWVVGHQFSETFTYTPLQCDKLPAQICEDIQVPNAAMNGLQIIIGLNYFHLYVKPSQSAYD